MSKCAMCNLARADAVALLSAVLLPACCASAARIADVTGVEIVQRLTGPGPHLTGDVAVGGTDLGHMVNHLGRTYFLFGDTFAGDLPGQGGFWRNNVMAYSRDSNPADGIEFEGWITNSAGDAHQVITSGKYKPPVITEIPTGAISVGGRIYAWYMAVDQWEPLWTARYGGLATWREGDPTFTVQSAFEFPSSHVGGNFGMVAASQRTDPARAGDDHVYLWGTPAGRAGGVKLARVNPAGLTDLNAYEYFGGMQSGQPTWVESEFDAPYVVAPKVGEMSVMYNEALQSWTMLYFNSDRYQIEIRQAPDPWGPWSNPVQVAHGSQFPQLYGSYMNPLYVEDGGQTIYFTMSMWNPYDVYLVKATFVTAPDLPGDFNDNGVVDAADYTIWRDHLGITSGATGWQGDFNGDGRVTQIDHAFWKSRFGDTLSAANGDAAAPAVPEPSSILAAVWAIGGWALMLARR